MSDDELLSQLTRFCRDHLAPDATVSGIVSMPGHAGFSWGFTVRYRRDGREETERLVLRLPPPGVRIAGPADVARQGRVLRSLQGTAVPVPPVRFLGEEPTWFGRPYLVVAWLEGRTLRSAEEPARPDLSRDDVRGMARQGVEAIAALHTLDWRSRVTGWGKPGTLEGEILRLDSLLERAPDPDLVREAPAVRERLLATLPPDPPTGLIHGDYQWTNLFYQGTKLVAVLDWELSGINATTLDIGWLCVFSDPESWVGVSQPHLPLPTPEELAEWYQEALGRRVPDVSWYRAYSGYRFGVIASFNLMLHRRGKRPDPHYEELAPSCVTLFGRAAELLGLHG